MKFTARQIIAWELQILHPWVGLMTTPHSFSMIGTYPMGSCYLFLQVRPHSTKNLKTAFHSSKMKTSVTWEFLQYHLPLLPLRGSQAVLFSFSLTNFLGFLHVFLAGKFSLISTGHDDNRTEPGREWLGKATTSSHAQPPSPCVDLEDRALAAPRRDTPVLSYFIFFLKFFYLSMCLC